jgi:antitoxin component YwqK of YwqJK toxin-antitoxin module
MGNICVHTNNVIATKHIDDYICTDLIKYCITDYISVNIIYALPKIYKVPRKFTTTSTYADKQLIATNYYYDNICYQKIFGGINNYTIIKNWYNTSKLKTYADGKLQYLENFKNLCGYIYKYYNFGSLLQKQQYKNGMCNGISITYYTDGKIYKINNYLNNKKDGMQYKYYITGSKKCSYNCIDGKKDGWYICYNMDGNITYSIYYEDDRKITTASFNNELFIYNI